MTGQQFRPGGFRLLPEVVKNLLIINGLLFLSTVVGADKLGIDLTRILGLHYPGSEYFRPWQFFTHLFMHGSWLHLLSNMFMLWMLGYALENIWGGKKFLIYYIVTGLGAALIHLAFTGYELTRMQDAINAYAAGPSFVDFEALAMKYKHYANSEILARINEVYVPWGANPGSLQFVDRSVEALELLIRGKENIPTVGASGAVFGVLLAFGMLFPNTIIYLYFAIPIKAKWFVIFYGMFELYAGIQNSPTDPIAHFAHLRRNVVWIHT